MYQHLTEYEHQIMFYIIKDYNNSQIAEIFGKKLPTMKKHIQKIYAKARVKTRLALSVAYVRSKQIPSAKAS